MKIANVTGLESMCASGRKGIELSVWSYIDEGENQTKFIFSNTFSKKFNMFNFYFSSYSYIFFSSSTEASLISYSPTYSPGISSGVFK